MKNSLKSLLLILLLLWAGYELNGLSNIIQPVASKPVKNDRPDILRKSLVLLGCPGHQIREVQYGIEIASNRTGIGGVLLSTLLYTESNFKRDAISPKGYRGIGQTPTATMKYVEVDILHGAMILRDKLRLTNGNMFEALALYKGGNNPVAKKQARQVIQIYNEVVKAVG